MHGGNGELVGTEKTAERRSEDEKGEKSKQRRQCHMAGHRPSIVFGEMHQGIVEDFVGYPDERWHQVSDCRAGLHMLWH